MLFKFSSHHLLRLDHSSGSVSFEYVLGSGVVHIESLRCFFDRNSLRLDDRYQLLPLLYINGTIVPLLPNVIEDRLIEDYRPVDWVVDGVD